MPVTLGRAGPPDITRKGGTAPPAGSSAVATVTDMATSVYVAAVEGYTGKSTVALGVLEQLSRRVERVAVYRPVVRGDAATDYVLDLLVSHDAVQLTYDECAGVTYADLHRDPEAALDRIVDRYHQVADKADAVVVVGSDYTDVGRRPSSPSTPRSRPTSAARCCWCSTPTAARPEELRTAADLAVSELHANHGTLFAIVANRANPAGHGDLDAVVKALDGLGVPAFALPEEPLLSAPSVGRPDGRLRRHAGQRRGVAAVAGDDRHRGRGDDAAARARPALRRRGRRHAGRPARGRAGRADRPGVARTSRRWRASCSTAASTLPDQVTPADRRARHDDADRRHRRSTPATRRRR